MSLAERLAQTERPDRVAEVRARIQHQMIEALGPSLYDSTVSEREMRELVHRRLSELLEADATPLTAREKSIILTDITDGVLGLGPLEALIKDESITEIMVNGPHSIYVEREGKLYKTDDQFFDEQQLRRTIEKIVAKVGRRIDEASPYVDARLADGSRVNAIIPPLALDGPALTIRKFAAEAYRVEELIGFGTWNAAAVEFMEACVSGRMNVIVSGGTGAGKTTTLNVLSSFIPSNERIITIEDAAELRLQQPHIVRLESRPSNIEGSGEVTIRDLVRNALRMRPNRIVIGEVRGGEALDMLQAMNTGHDGSISTVHAKHSEGCAWPAPDHGAYGRDGTHRQGRTRTDQLSRRHHRPSGQAQRRLTPHYAYNRGTDYGGRRHHPPRHLQVRLPRGNQPSGPVPWRIEADGDSTQVPREAC